MNTCRAISLHQPWASLVIAGVKTRETRSWRAPKTIIGKRILIHAAKTHKGMRAAPGTKPDAFWTECLACLNCQGLPFGSLIGSIVIDGCLETDYLRPELKDIFGDYSPGRFAWKLAKPLAFDTPVPYPGRQGIFKVPHSALLP